jgi:hypothetical protein
LSAVTTETEEITVQNDRFKQMLYDESGDPADGALLLASVEGGHHPISAWVGEDVTSPWVRVDLNRVYSEVSNRNLQLWGNEELTLWGFGALLGNYVNVQKISTPTGSEQTGVFETSFLSTATGCSLDLKIDLNIIGTPFVPPSGLTSYDLLRYLRDQTGGDSEVVKNIRHYNSGGTWETAYWLDGEPDGVEFPLKAGKSYVVYLSEDMYGTWFEGIAHGMAGSLSVGLNLVSLPATAEPVDYTSYEMLEDLGNESQVSSLKRYDNIWGWQSTSWFMGVPSGNDFDTTMGEGYLIYMKEEKVNWRPY